MESTPFYFINQETHFHSETFPSKEKGEVLEHLKNNGSNDPADYFPIVAHLQSTEYDLIKLPPNNKTFVIKELMFGLQEANINDNSLSFFGIGKKKMDFLNIESSKTNVD